MKRKNKFLLSISCACLITAIAIGILFYPRNEIPSFDIRDYSRILHNKQLYGQFTCDITHVDASTPDKAIEAAEMIWCHQFGSEESTIGYKPYQIFYDEDADVFLIRNTPPTNEHGIRLYWGGGLNLLVTRSTGTVIAVWGDK